MDLSGLDEKTAFKLGFAARCQEEGRSPAEVSALIKAADGGISAAGLAIGSLIASGAAGLYSAGKQVLSDAKLPAQIALGIPIAAGLAGGAGLGYGAAKITAPDYTADDVKAKELADAYKVYTDRLKARRAYAEYRKARGLA